MKAVIRSYGDNIEGKVIGEVEMVDGRVQIRTDHASLREDLLSGVRGETFEKYYTITDGEDFIRALPIAYSGSRVRAELE